MAGGKIKAIIFDIGGVVVDSPIMAIRNFCVQRSISDLNHFLFSSSTWAATERGQLAWSRFAEAALQECQDKGFSDGISLGLDGWRELQRAIKEGGVRPRVPMLRAITRLRAAGFVVAALTNNIAPEGAAESSGLQRLRSLFDHFVESSVTKMRKPEPDFYAHALRVVGCEAAQAVFLDDIGKNLKPAKDMGIFTIHVQNETPLQYLEALQKLQGLLSIKLLEDEDFKVPAETTSKL